MKNGANSELRIISGLRVVVDFKLDELKRNTPYRIVSSMTSVTPLVWTPTFGLAGTLHSLIAISSLLFQVMFLLERASI